MQAAPAVVARPLVYLGASLSREEGERLAPHFEFAGPIARNDLYGERARGRSVFLIIDGVFGHKEAVSAREVVDVVRDGALVLGASSMGALRAAECWPVGVRGIGLIYRLYRLGVLDTDDEVAVALGGNEAGSVSVALVNVRYAVSKARTAGAITRREADALVASASRFFYADRRWRTIFRDAGLGDAKAEVFDFVISFDLKKRDARKAVSELVRLVETGEGTPRETKPQESFSPHPDEREAPYDAFAGTSPDDVMAPLVGWLVGTGRCLRYMSELLVSSVGNVAPLSTTPRLPVRRSPFSRLVSEARSLYQGRPGLPLAQALGSALVVLLDREDVLAERMWTRVDAAGMLDAEVMRFRAAHSAAGLAKARGLTVRPRDQSLAELEIAGNYGFEAWASFRNAPQYLRLKPWIEPALATLAAAKRVRAASTDGVIVEGDP